MVNLKNKYWTHALIWLFCIYATLPVARSISEFLRERVPFSLLISLSFVLIFVFICIFLFTKIKIKKRSSYLLLALVGLSGIAILGIIKIPEEKIHFLQYGLLAFLVHRALRLDIKDAKIYLISFFLVSMAGWIDEGIQYLLPGRYYDIRDVLFNILGGILGLCITLVIRREEACRALKT